MCLVTGHTSSLRGLSLQALTLIAGVGFKALRLRFPFLGECCRGQRHFLGMPGASGLRPCAWTHIKKALCHTRLVSGTEDKYRLFQAKIAVIHLVSVRASLTGFTCFPWCLRRPIGGMPTRPRIFTFATPEFLPVRTPLCHIVTW